MTSQGRSKRMNWHGSHTIVCLVTLIILSTILFAGPVSPARAQATMTVGIYSEDYFSANVTDPSLRPGSVFIMDVQVVNPPPIVNSSDGGINGFTILVNYDPSILNATGADFKSPLCPSSLGCLFDANAFGLPPHINDPPGNTTISAVRLGGVVSAPVGILYRIQFKVKGIGYTDITVFPSTPSKSIGVTGPVNNTAAYIPYDPANGSFDNRPPFIMSANPATGSVIPGQSVSTNLTTSLVVAPPDNVSLSIVSQLPAGTSYSLNPSFGIYPLNSNITLTTSASTPLGNYQVTINGTCLACSPGTGAPFTQIVVFPFQVQAGFTISLNRTSATIFQGQSVAVMATVALDGLAQQVSLSVPGLPAGVTASITPPSGTPTFTSILTFTTSATATIGTLQLQIVGTSTSSLVRAAGFNLTVQTVPDIGITAVTATPSVVNLDGTVTVTVTVASQGVLSETFAVTATATDSNGNIHAIGTTLVNGLLAGQSQMVTISWSTQGLPAGTYTIHAQVPVLTAELHVTDNAMTGNSVRLNAPPTASFTVSTTTPNAGDQVSFDASASSDTDGTITYSWNFGDGGTGTGKTAAHSYQKAGTHTVTLTVTDNDGATRMFTQTVTVAQSGIGASDFVTSPTGLSIIAVVIAAAAIGMLLLRRRGRNTKSSQSKPTKA